MYTDAYTCALITHELIVQSDQKLWEDRVQWMISTINHAQYVKGPLSFRSLELHEPSEHITAIPLNKFSVEMKSKRRLLVLWSKSLFWRLLAHFTHSLSIPCMKCPPSFFLSEGQPFWNITNYQMNYSQIHLYCRRLSRDLTLFS